MRECKGHGVVFIRNDRNESESGIPQDDVLNRSVILCRC